jgi:hypothetical protein
MLNEQAEIDRKKRLAEVSRLYYYTHAEYRKRKKERMSLYSKEHPTETQYITGKKVTQKRRAQKTVAQQRYREKLKAEGRFKVYYKNKRQHTKNWLSKEGNMQKYHAHMKVHYATKNGILKRMPCEKCGNEKAQGHHDDYSKPLSVRWLCAKHHSEHHYSLKHSLV